MPRFYGENFCRVGSSNPRSLRSDPKNSSENTTDKSETSLKVGSINNITPESIARKNDPSSSNRDRLVFNSDCDERIEIQTEIKSKATDISRDDQTPNCANDRERKSTKPFRSRRRRRKQSSVKLGCDADFSTESKSSSVPSLFKSDIKNKDCQNEGKKSTDEVVVEKRNIVQERDKENIAHKFDDELLIDEDEDEPHGNIATLENIDHHIPQQEIDDPEYCATNQIKRNIQNLEITNNNNNNNNNNNDSPQKRSQDKLLQDFCKESHTEISNEDQIASINQQNLILVSEVLKKVANFKKEGQIHEITKNQFHEKDSQNEAITNEIIDARSKCQIESTNLKPEMDCAIKKTAWFPLDSDNTSTTPNLRLRVPLMKENKNDLSNVTKALKFPCLLSDFEGNDGSSAFIVRSSSINPNVMKESIEIVGYVEESQVDGFANLSDSEIMPIMRKQQSFATLQWETQILYIIFRCTKNRKMRHSENYFPIPRSITYEKGIETIRLCLNMDIASSSKTSTNSSPIICESVVLGTIQDVFNLHIQFNEGPMPEAVIAYFALKIIDIMDIVHSCSVAHNNLGLDSFLVVCDNVKTSENSSLRNSAAFHNWGLRLIGFGAKSTVVRCKNQNEPDGKENDTHTCTKWHFEPDLYAFANMIHLLLTGGMNMSWKKSSKGNEETKIEIELKSFISGNKYLSGSLAWESLFEELLNNPDRDSGVNTTMQTLSESTNKSDKISSAPFLSNTVKLLKLVTENEANMSKYLKKLYLHLESERNLQSADTRNNHSSKIIFPTYYERASGFPKGILQTPHCTDKCCYSDQSEKPDKLGRAVSKFRSLPDRLQDNSILKQKELQIKAQEMKILQRENDLNEMMKNGEKELQLRRKELDSVFNRLEDAEKQLIQYKIHREKIEKGLKKECLDQAEKWKQCNQEKLVQIALFQEKQNRCEDTINHLSNRTKQIDYMKEESIKKQEEINDLRRQLLNKDKFIRQNLEHVKNHSGSQDCIEQLRQSNEAKKRQIHFFQERQAEMSEQIQNLHRNLTQFNIIKNEYSKQQQNIDLLEKEIEKKEEKIKEQMFMLMKRQDAIATLEAQLKETSEKLKRLISNQNDRFSHVPQMPDFVDIFNTPSDREKMLKHREFIFMEKLKQREAELDRRSLELENEKEMLGFKINHTMGSFNKSGVGLFQNNDDSNIYDTKMKSLFEREAALLQRVRAFDALKLQCENNLVAREHKVCMLERSMMNRPNQMNLKRNYEMEPTESASNINVNQMDHRSKRYKSDNSDEKIISLLDLDSD